MGSSSRSEGRCPAPVRGAEPMKRFGARRGSSIMLFFACAAGGAACSGSSGGPETSAAITLDNLCATFAKADCDRLQRCDALKPPIDRERCLFRQEKVRCAPYAGALKRAIDGGELTYSEPGARRCRDRISALDCAIGFDYDYFRDPACADLAGGQGRAGARCSLPSSCASGLFCRSPATCPGVCQALKGNNDPCSPSEPCTKDLFCAVTGMRCRGRAGLNAPCEMAISGSSCADGSFCDQSGVGTPRCTVVRGRGNGCLTPYECAPGLRCINSLCSGGMERDTCVTDADCGGTLRCGGGRCVAPALERAACASSKPCAEGLVCTSSAAMTACTKGLASGAQCSPTRPCYLGRCVNGTCAVLIADQESCASTEECLPGRACAMGRCTPAAPACNE